MHLRFWVYINDFVPFFADEASFAGGSLLILMSLEEALKFEAEEPKLPSDFKFCVYLLRGFAEISFSDSFLEIVWKLLVLGFDSSSWAWLDCVEGLEYWSIKVLAGGQANVLLGIVLGIG